MARFVVSLKRPKPREKKQKKNIKIVFYILKNIKYYASLTIYNNKLFIFKYIKSLIFKNFIGMEIRLLVSRMIN